jgi:hypothetical protein
MFGRWLQVLLTDARLSPSQRAAHYISVGFILLSIGIAANLRDSILNAVSAYTNIRAGISATYPQNWLLDNTPQALFRVRDVAHLGFQTTIQISLQPVSETTTLRALRDALTLERAQLLDGYDVIEVTPVFLSDETPALEVGYTYVALDTDPFLQGIPIAVQGLDMIAIRRDQAIVITFLSDASRYEQNLPTFQRFLANLQF